MSPIVKSVLGAFLLVSMMASGAFAQSFGAIAYSPSTGAAAWNHSYPNQSAAENAALVGCYKHARDCRVVVWYDRGCGALAVSPGGAWGSAYGPNSAAAQNNALASCSAHDRGCYVKRWQCSGAR